jgi:hypothetical protein
MPNAGCRVAQLFAAASLIQARPASSTTTDENQCLGRENPKVRAQALQGTPVFAARFGLQHSTDKWACNTKMCYTPISAPDLSKRKACDLQAFRIAGAGFEPATFGL